MKISNHEYLDWKYALKCVRCCYIQFCCSFYCSKSSSSRSVGGAGQLKEQSHKELLLNQTEQTVVNLQFLNNSGSDAYTFKLVDGVSGLTAEVAALTVDMTSQVSKDAFVASLNLSGQTGQTDSVITGSTTNFSAVEMLSISQVPLILEK